MAKKLGGLGKGLSAIFIENETEEKGSVVTLHISEITPNRSQPRRAFDEEALAELADSIKAHGVLQPILVRPLLQGGYQIVAGERRYRAARLAGLNEIPATVRELSEEETMELALIENLQRENLSPMEEASGYKHLMDTYSLSQEQVAQAVGKSRSAVANSVRLLTLDDSIRELVDDGKLSAGHARALLSIEDQKLQKSAADDIVKKGLSVRDAEKLAKKLNKNKTEKKPAKTQTVPVLYKETELALSEALGQKVVITKNKNGGGTLSIDFYSDEELLSLAHKFEQ
ncbi:MAG: ParB/RepB/Spo0J family partition protein [Ruminococcus sp.]|nr:ParB/RepB/Spo0J family partition protein [Ruminococcus sp.]